MTIKIQEVDSFSPQHREEPAVIIDHIYKSFNDRTVLKDLSFTVQQGEFLTILGKSGGGKSTLLKILSGLESHDSGTVLSKPRQTIVFQEPRLIRGRKVWENGGVH